MHELRERDAELAVLRAALADAAKGRGSIAVVGGEAGIGKSSLLRAFLAGAATAVRVLAGGCDDLLAARPLAPLRDAVRTVPGPLADALGDSTEHDLLDAAVAQLAARPSLLVVDDVQWADDATLDVLRHVARRIAQLPALLVLAVRRDALRRGHPAQALLGALAGLPVTHLDLAPLTPAAVAAMAGTRDAATLHRITGGNPFFVTEALAAPQGVLSDSVADAVRARLSGLPPESVAALEALSVVPTPVEPTLAAGLLGDRIAALAAAEEQGVVELRAAGLSFRHELARRAVESTLPGLRRRALHARVVAALRESGSARAEQLVHHAVAAGDAGTVLEFAPAAARDAAAGGSHRQALAHLEAAAAFADRLAPEPRAGLLSDLAWQLYIAQRFGEAIAVGRTALDLCAGLELPQLEAALSVRLSRYLLMSGELAEAERLHQRATALLGDHGSPAARAELAGNYGSLLLLTSRWDEAAPQLRTAAGLAAEAGRPDLQALALAYLGLARYESGEIVGGEADVREALELSVRHRCDEAAVRIYTNLGEMLAVAADWSALAATVAQGRAFCAERGIVRYAALLDLQECQLRMRAGEWDVAESGLRELATRGRGIPTFVPRIEACLGRLLARRGADEAGGLVQGAWQEARRQQHPTSLLHAGLAVAEWAWLHGTTAATDEVAEVLLPRLARSPAWAWPRGELCRYLARAGVAVEPFDGCPDPYAAGLRGEWRTAAAVAERVGDPYERALELGFSGDPDAMIEGWVALDAMGAAAARPVRQELRARGLTRLPRRRRPERRPGPAGLTQRQLDVLDLIGEGATNAEIAGRLDLSVRTVDHHVAAILTRLGARNRREAVRAARAVTVRP
ncbi:AAA family ATPase [Pseudonocardia sp. DSM 110487]|uniref:ATP-binding protein n=1 Tax=Pseudonocardia sp. DSM 110487 TaxID=2865833 RepID=UPI001C69A954|nr:LuxR family transcriptional regulator [Pseudonocardia sp. DSM 110487]QYN32331.1 AAA family ATPase [Pseudonocardia sp. DSM 110487]